MQDCYKLLISSFASQYHVDIFCVGIVSLICIIIFINITEGIIIYISVINTIIPTYSLSNFFYIMQNKEIEVFSAASMGNVLAANCEKNEFIRMSFEEEILPNRNIRGANLFLKI